MVEVQLPFEVSTIKHLDFIKSLNSRSQRGQAPQHSQWLIRGFMIPTSRDKVPPRHRGFDSIIPEHRSLASCDAFSNRDVAIANYKLTFRTTRRRGTFGFIRPYRTAARCIHLHRRKVTQRQVRPTLSKTRRYDSSEGTINRCRNRTEFARCHLVLLPAKRGHLTVELAVMDERRAKKEEPRINESRNEHLMFNRTLQRAA